MRYLLYFYKDKNVHVVDEDQVFLEEFSDFTAKDWLKTGQEECKVKVFYENDGYEACVLQVMPDGADNHELVKKIRSLIHLKKTRASKLLSLITRVMPERRQKMIPLDIMDTDSESDERTTASEKSETRIPLEMMLRDKENRTEYGRQKLVKENAQPPSASVSAPSRMSVKREEPSCPEADATAALVSISSSSLAAGAWDSLFENPDMDMFEIYQRMRELTVKNGIEPDSNEAVLFFLAAILEQVSRLESQISRLEKSVETACHVTKRRTEGNFPVFHSIKQMQDEKSYPKGMIEWMKLEGGLNARDHIRRVMMKLIKHDLHVKINRQGTFGKTMFPLALQDLLKESTTTLFPGTTHERVEKMISAFFKTAGDRFGGRNRRRLQNMNKRNSDSSDATAFT